MKKIEVILKPFKMEEVKTALSKAGVQGLTISEIRGFGRQRGHKERYRGSEYTVELVPKVKMEVAVADNSVSSIVEVILKSARTGELGDGKIFVYPLEGAVRIRTGEQGEAAL
ncbi:MAG TPA: P-II family nitrogen regulator [Planctomycetota bacterium]|nr:P-II family nitrogen regulator [Planctomycetota bacterium]